MRILLKSKIAWLAMALGMIVVVSGCGVTGNQASSEEFTVAAASDVQPALERILRAYDPQLKKSTSIYGSSGLLARQIEQGAPVDLYISASKTYIDQLDEKKLVVGEPKAVARGVLVWVTRVPLPAIPAPAGRGPGWLAVPPNHTGFDARFAAAQGKIAIANPDHAPYGKAAVEALTKARLWEKVRPRIVYGESVAQAFQQFKSGAVESAIVSKSQAIAAHVRFIEVPQYLYQPIDLRLALIGKGKANPEAADFARFLSGKTGMLILTKYGYRVTGGE